MKFIVASALTLPKRNQIYTGCSRKIAHMFFVNISKTATTSELIF